MNEILATIKDLGFPIAGCIVLAKYINKMSDIYRSEIKELSKIIERNTDVLQKIYSHIIGGGIE